ncbi:copper amine oxidase N-terminal domain-containing protein [Paenibacillus endoradicis]|uniref:copper amine oxidase N-terminal domain-containing protein n=1 Tax=Paenibacillus endoradicis TaxID=2972487 RepID=UPI002158FBDD|nr:copper amine oxidase N-terminal domain-containing protein [Paenibacillus endoradicis]MCR8660390.1 copper amine oxidase N-terminal domain-containing protein [Paenibacillus endoradicis]
MKRFILGFVCAAIIFGANSTYAASTVETIKAWLRGEITVTSNDNLIKLNNTPLMYNNTTYLSVRDIATTFNQDIKWDKVTNTIKLTTKHDGSIKYDSETGTAIYGNKQPDFIFNYFANNHEPAIVVNDEIYINSWLATEKFNMPISIMDSGKSFSVDTISSIESYAQIKKYPLTEHINYIQPGDGFYYNGYIYLREKIVEEASLKRTNVNIFTKEYNYLEQNITYQDDETTMMVTMNSILQKKFTDYTEYSISYTLRNANHLTQTEGSFRLYLTNGQYLKQSGHFGYISSGDEIKRTYTFSVPNDKVLLCIEYNGKISFSKQVPSDDSLKWTIK